MLAEMPKGLFKRPNAALCAVLVLVSCLVYANTLKNGYVLDDVMMITGNQYVSQGLNGIPALFTTPHLRGFGSTLPHDYYRPLSLVMFAIEYAIFGLNPAEGHLVNVLLFAACVVLLFVFLDQLFDHKKTVAAFVAALLYAVHPVHTEVVANIKSRDELLCFFFSFIALIQFARYAGRGRAWQYVAGTLCLLLAILSKETVGTFLAVIPLVFFFYKNTNRKRSVLVCMAICIVVSVFMAAWHYVEKYNSGHPGADIGALANVATFKGRGAQSPEAGLLAAKIAILGYHLRLLLAPYPLNSNYSFADFDISGIGYLGVLLSLAVYVALIFTGATRLFKFPKDPWAFGILFYLFTISLYSNMLFLLGQPMADRYAFFPSAGFCLVAALAFDKWVLRARTTGVRDLVKLRPLAVLVPVVLCYSVMTIARNADWKDNLTLISADLSKSANDPVMQYKAGLELLRKADAEPDSTLKRTLTDQSIRHFSRSIEVYPDYTESHSDIGVAYFNENKFDSARRHYKLVLELNPVHLNANVNLGTLYFREESFGDAIFYYRKALKIDPAVDIAWYNLAICYARLQQPDSAMYCIKKVIEIAPQYDNYRSFGNAAILYEAMGNLDSARRYEQLTRQYFPEFRLRSSVEK